MTDGYPSYRPLQGMPGGERDDHELLRAHVAGDPTAFAELVRRHRQRMWAVAMRTLADPEEAADAVQEALISAMRNAGQFRGEAAVTTWLHRVVVNACLDRLRRRKARPSVPLGDIEVGSRRDDHAAAEARLMVRQALAQLPEPQREAIVLVDLEELSVAEAAAHLGVPEGTIKSRCFRGRLELARILGALEPADAPQIPGTTGNRTPSPHVAEHGTRARTTPGPATSGGGR